MGSVTNWTKVTFIPETGDWWLDIKDNFNSEPTHPPSYEPPPESDCTRNVNTHFRGMVLNTYMKGMEIITSRTDFPAGIPMFYHPYQFSLHLMGDYAEKFEGLNWFCVGIEMGW